MSGCWSGREDLNLRPHEPHSCALPGCATPRHSNMLIVRYNYSLCQIEFVGNLKYGGRGTSLLSRAEAHRGRRGILNSGGRIAANEFAGMIHPFLPPSSFLLPPSSFLLPPSSFLLPPSSFLLPRRVLYRRRLIRRQIVQSRDANAGARVIATRGRV